MDDFQLDPLLSSLSAPASLCLQSRHVANNSTQTFTLVRYPTDNDIELDKQIVGDWQAWWSTTSWVQGSDTHPPRPAPAWNSSKRSSAVWADFGEAATLDTGTPYVYCLRCGDSLVHPSPGNIGNKHMTNHARSARCQKIHNYRHSRSKGQIALEQLKRHKETTEFIPPFSSDKFNDELLKVLVACNWSFRTLERPRFQRFVKFLRPDAEVPSRSGFASLFKTHFTNIQSNLLSTLGQHTKVSIALDGWSSNNHLSFLAIKAYYITDDWQAEERLLDMRPLRGRHSGEQMAKEVLEVLSMHGLHKKLLAITADNASNNNTMRSTLEGLLANFGVTWDAAENTIPCLTHIINLVIQDILKNLKIDSPDKSIGA